MVTSLLGTDDTCIVILDVQEKLMPVMARKERVIDNLLKLIHLSKLYNLPVILTEQYPKWLGPTISEVKKALSTYDPLEKMHFNCCDAGNFNTRQNNRQVE